MNMIVNREIEAFVKFLNSSLPIVKENFILSGYTDLELRQKIDDFIQVNWEILVEQVICGKGQYLEYYDSGADVYPESCRVIHPNAGSSKKIIVKPLVIKDEFQKDVNELEYLDFMKFVSIQELEFFSDNPPFTHVMCEDQSENQYFIDMKNFDFILVDL